jgi:hypothetical protein
MDEHLNTLLTYSGSLFLINVFSAITEAELTIICQISVTLVTIVKIVHDMKKSKTNER